MRIALRIVLLLVVVLVLLFAGQAFETRRLASAHASRVADLRQQGILGPTNPCARDASREARAWVERLGLLAEAAGSLPDIVFVVRGATRSTVPPPTALPILQEARGLEALLAEVPAGVSRVGEPQPQGQTIISSGLFPPSVSAVFLSASRSSGNPAREAVLGHLLAFAAQYSLREPGGSRIAARRMGAVLELLELLDGGSLAVGQTRLEVERAWLAHLASLRERPELDHVLFFERLEPILARVGTLERARRGLGRMVERNLGPGHAPWNEEPPAMAIFERGGRLDDARMLLDELEVQLGILNTGAELTSPRLPSPGSTRLGGRRVDRELAHRCESDLAAARELDLARVVLALDAHRQETGSWPARLPELGRWFPAGIPIDPRTDAPFDYGVAGTTATVQVASLSPGAPSSPATATGPRLRWDLEAEQ